MSLSKKVILYHNDLNRSMDWVNNSLREKREDTKMLYDIKAKHRIVKRWEKLIVSKTDPANP